MVAELKNKKGQALVETVLVIFLFYGMFFGLVQVFLLATTKMETFDAAHAAARSKIVNCSPLSAYSVFIPHPTFGKTFFPVVQTEEVSPVKTIKNSEGSPVYITKAKVNYLQKVMFKDFFTLGIPYIRGRSEAMMINSPEPAYFDRAFPEGS